MSDTMYYEKPVLLDRDKHRKRRVRQSNSFAFAKKANSLFVAGVEFNEASKEYAIVFTRVGNGKVVPVVGGVLSNGAAYRYLPKSVAYLPPVPELLAMVGRAGFVEVDRHALSGGISQLITATRG